MLEILKFNFMKENAMVKKLPEYKDVLRGDKWGDGML